MTMENEMTSIPNLRFPDFEGEWKINKLKKMFVNSRNKGNETLSVFSVSQERGLVPRNSLDRKMKNDAKSEDNLSVEPKDLAYNMMRMWQGAVGVANQKCMVSPAYVVLKPTKGISSEFFIQLFKKKRSLYLFTSYSYGLTSDRLRLYFKDFASIKFATPSLPEQQKIVSFLSAIDQKIQQLSRKKELLEQYKKGVLQKIFSREIRFQDENGQDYPDWQEKYLGDVFAQRIEKRSENSELLSVTINKGVIRRSDIEAKNNSSKDKSNYKQVLIGDIVYNSMRMWQGASGASSFEGIVSPAYTVLKGNQKNSTDYFSYFFKMRDVIFVFRRFSQGLTSDTWNLKYPQLAQIKFKIPCLKEQVRIAEFLKELDRKVEFIQTQLTATLTFKKGLLQQLFV